ncbi:MAG: hypothetical protein M3163_14045 [Actinomycetota bacterium]|nr:hypothetical protein [Actinomycetota bacterium]
MLIDHQDHYSYADSTISAYNFLQYDEREWARWNPSLQYQNRLRHSDYLAMFEAEGFEIVHESPTAGSPDDLAVIGQLPLANPFRDIPPAHLAVRNALVILRSRRS